MNIFIKMLNPPIEDKRKAIKEEKNDDNKRTKKN